MEDYYIVSFSGGKDSTAMLFHLMELGNQIDEVIYCDTQLDFPAMYEHIEKVKKKVEEAGIKFTILRAEKTFEYLLTEQLIHKRDGTIQIGKGWATPRTRWCSGELKLLVISKYERELKKQYNVYHYVGLAADELYRLERKGNQKKYHIHPLVEWGWTEADCLSYCYSLGYDWGGLYQDFKRVSCWCCPLQSLEELRVLFRKYKPLWEKLKELDSKAYNQFRADYSVEELEKRFIFEEEWLKTHKNARTRDFYKALKAHLGKQ